MAKRVSPKIRAIALRHAAESIETLVARDKEPKFGAHVVVIESLNGSTVYGANVLAKVVTYWQGPPKYLCKEATSQAWYRRDFRCVGGSIPLGIRGGDRVILSR